MMKSSELVRIKTLTESYLRKYNRLIEDNSFRLIDLLENHNVLRNPMGPNKTTNGDHLLGMPSAVTQDSGKERSYTSFISTYALTHNIWDINDDPIDIVWGPFEDMRVDELISSIPTPNGNPDVRKVLLVLVNLVREVKDLRIFGWDHFIFQLMLYGEGFESESSLGLSYPSSEYPSKVEGDGHVSISHFLRVLYELKDFLRDVHTLLCHCFRQLETLFKDTLPLVVSITGVNFPSLFHELGNLVALVIIIDEVITSQPSLIEHWRKYKKMICSIRADSANFDVDCEALATLEAELVELDRCVLSQRIFINLIDYLNSNLKFNKRNLTLLEKFTFHFNTLESNLEQNFNNGSDNLRPIAFAGLFVLISTILPFDVKKVFRTRIWPILRRIPAVPIGGNMIWTPDGFFNSLQQANIINYVDGRILEGQVQARHVSLEGKIGELQYAISKAHIEVHSWTIRLQELLYGRDISQIRKEDLSKRSACLLDGLKLSQTLTHDFRLLLNLHGSLGRPVTIQVLNYLIQHLELLKTIQASFYRFNVQICHTVLFLVQTVQHIALTNVKQVKESLAVTLNKSNKDIEAKNDSMTVVSILENALQGPPSEERLITAKVAFDWSVGRCFGEDDDRIRVIEVALERIESMVNILNQIEYLCSGSWVYWHKQLFSTYFSALYSNELESVSKLPTLFLIIDDCLHMLNEKSPHQDRTVVSSFLNEVECYIKGSITSKLCSDIEIDLRLQTHSHLNPTNTTPDDAKMVVCLRNLLELPSLALNNDKTNMKYLVQQYLSKNFYNLASVALHDWQSYATMRILARDKYGLDIVQDYLPGHSLEQGQDILNIVRSLKKFVTEYCYNINNQVFVQVHSPNKHLETVSIRHLANSMRTHGLGMSNNTVNCAYQFLRTKIHSFSQFLFDEQIRSRLTKDLRTFKAARQTQEGMTNSALTNMPYPYEKAQKFQNGIRKLGLTCDHLSPLDQFRVLITQIGNTLGFVRLVVSGGCHYLAQGTRFLTESGKNGGRVSATVQYSGNDHNIFLLHDEILAAAAGLDKGVEDLTSHKSPGIHFFYSLVSAFHSACVQSSNAHMRNFFVIIPALTLSFVDYMRSCKEKLSKKSKSTTIFSDDGFPMGLAYMLKVLDQDEDFDSLQWFSGVTHKLIEDRKRALQVIRDCKSEEKLQQAYTLTAKRIEDILHEFHLLRYNLSSARIFFQQSLHAKP